MITAARSHSVLHAAGATTTSNQPQKASGFCMIKDCNFIGPQAAGKWLQVSVSSCDKAESSYSSELLTGSRSDFSSVFLEKTSLAPPPSYILCL
ncbi:hypothetical protein AMECASPLE_034863 [Ameca splendens]|uniref:Uncharacterized protein n=1 Tax=Ameca splendens TaxID=208324 RepID=A0ABV0ZTK6_9TELE